MPLGGRMVRKNLAHFREAVLSFFAFFALNGFLYNLHNYKKRVIYHATTDWLCIGNFLFQILRDWVERYREEQYRRRLTEDTVVLHPKDVVEKKQPKRPLQENEHRVVLVSFFVSYVILFILNIMYQ